jgi:hypothetical protein
MKVTNTLITAFISALNRFTKDSPNTIPEFTAITYDHTYVTYLKSLGSKSQHFIYSLA